METVASEMVSSESVTSFHKKIVKDMEQKRDVLKVL